MGIGNSELNQDSSELPGHTELTLLDDYNVHSIPDHDRSEDEKQHDLMEVSHTNEEFKADPNPQLQTPKFVN